MHWLRTSASAKSDCKADSNVQCVQHQRDWPIPRRHPGSVPDAHQHQQQAVCKNDGQCRNVYSLHKNYSFVSIKHVYALDPLHSRLSLSSQLMSLD